MSQGPFSQIVVVEQNGYGEISEYLVSEDDPTQSQLLRQLPAPPDWPVRRPDDEPPLPERPEAPSRSLPQDLTFADLVRLEPRLGQLLDRARAYHAKAGPKFCANAVWYGYFGRRGLRSQLQQLVGWEADQEGVLGTSRAYDVAYRTLYQALPDCGQECVCQMAWA